MDEVEKGSIVMNANVDPSSSGGGGSNGGESLGNNDNGNVVKNLSSQTANTPSIGDSMSPLGSGLNGGANGHSRNSSDGDGRLRHADGNFDSYHSRKRSRSHSERSAILR